MSLARAVSSFRFNPRSHAGSDRRRSRWIRDRSRFNPRSHAGSDRRALVVLDPRERFNPRSHAGSDSRSLFPLLLVSCFNPRSHAGSDGAKGGCRNEYGWFQSTLPRGERPGIADHVDVADGFQSTLPRGERHFLLYVSFLLYSFNPRSHAGSDPAHTAHHTGFSRFNPRSHAGSDVCRFLHDEFLLCFNPRSHAGSDTSARRPASP